MGRENVKKAYQSSVQRLGLYRNITYGLNAIWLLCTLTLYSEEDGGGYGIGTWSGLSFWFGQEYLMITLLTYLFSPAFDSFGTIVDCNDVTDPKVLGHYSYAQDCLWVCWIVQFGTLLSRYFWFLYLVIPLFVVYQIVTRVGPMILQYLMAGQEGGSGGGGQGNQGPKTLAQRRAEAGKRRF
eukprot:PhF_6_TR18592/c0_g1_i1/m.27156